MVGCTRLASSCERAFASSLLIVGQSVARLRLRLDLPISWVSRYLARVRVLRVGGPWPWVVLLPCACMAASLDRVHLSLEGSTMSRFLALRDASQPSKAAASVFPDELVREYPALVEALGGTFDEAGKCKSCMYTLMLFVEGGKLKFNLSSKFDSQVCWGVVEDPVDIVKSVNEALELGRVDWRRGKNKPALAESNGNR